MSGRLSEVLSPDDIETFARAIADAAGGRKEEAVQRLLDAQRHQGEAALCLIWAVNEGHVARDEGHGIFAEIAQAYADAPAILGALGESLGSVRDVDDLNAPPPDHPLFRSVLDRLSAFADEDGPHKAVVLRGLATTARMMARQHDAIAERCYRRLIELAPRDSVPRYNLGLFCKTRGRFAEGLTANQAAARLGDETTEATEWNLGICATGAREGAAALKVWKRMGQVIEMGRFGLPEGTYPQCKVKLAERPLAERDAGTDDPGLEESIWIERLSPCHGIVRSVLYQDLGVDYGDVILFDGAPITYHTYGDTDVPVFPHLATLERRGYQLFDFAGTQGKPGQLADASCDLAGDAIVYSHSENYQTICASCWRDPTLDHARHEGELKHVVVGRIAAPPEAEPAGLLGALDAALEQRGSCQLHAPDLSAAAGYHARAEVDRRRYAMLTGG